MQVTHIMHNLDNTYHVRKVRVIAQHVVSYTPHTMLLQTMFMHSLSHGLSDNVRCTTDGVRHYTRFGQHLQCADCTGGTPKGRYFANTDTNQYSRWTSEHFRSAQCTGKGI